MQINGQVSLFFLSLFHSGVLDVAFQACLRKVRHVPAHRVTAIVVVQVGSKGV